MKTKYPDGLLAADTFNQQGDSDPFESALADLERGEFPAQALSNSLVRTAERSVSSPASAGASARILLNSTSGTQGLDSAISEIVES